MNNYFMATGEHKPLTRIILEQYEKRYIVESPYSDENLLENLIDLTYSALLAAGYNNEHIARAFYEFAEEKGHIEEDVEEDCEN